MSFVRFRRAQQAVGNLDGVFAYGRFDLRRHVRVFLQEFAHVFPPLADPHTVVGEPGAGLFDEARLNPQIDDLPELGNALAIHDVELNLAERRGDLVLHHLDLDIVADHLVAKLDLARAPNVEPNRRIEFQGIAARGGFGAAIHDADLHANLVDEDDDALGLGNRAGELAKGLTHQPRLQARQAVAHISFDFGPWRQGRHTVDHDNIHRVGAHQRIGNLQGLLARIRLRDE